MVGLNVFIRDGSICVGNFSHNKSCKVAFRKGAFLLSLHFNSMGSLEETGFLVDFKGKRIFKLEYFESRLLKKEETRDKKLFDQVFNKNQYVGLTGD